MGKYREFIMNDSVSDVFWYVINGCKSVKEIEKKLKQPQSTISEKLGFLVDEGVIVKEKWEFTPNWRKIIEISKDDIKKFLKYFVKPPEETEPTKKEVKGAEKYIEEFINGYKNCKFY